MNRIKELRKAKNMKQVELANAISVSQAALSGYETGKYEPDFDTLQRIAEFFHVSIDYILGRDEKKPVAETDNGREREFVQLFEKLTPEQQDMVLAQLKGVVESQGK